MLKTTAIATGALALSRPAFGAQPGKRMGVSTSSYGVRWRRGTDDGSIKPFGDSLGMIDHCQTLGAGGVQIGVRNWTPEFAREVRERIERYGMFLEGQIRLPRDESDVDRFDHEVSQAKEAGITIIRTVMLGGRRYETFQTLEAWNEFKASSWHSLTLAKPVMEKQQVKLAVENHKDWRIPEMLDVIERIDSEWIGINLDFGNNLSLLDQPMDVIEAFAPHTFTTHFKDMAVEEYEDGFLLSEVPLGDGFFELSKMMTVLEKANPNVQYHLEMITRDPLKVPIYTDQYWLTFQELPAVHLAETLSMLKQHPPKKPLPTTSDKSVSERVAFEEFNVAESFRHAQDRLGL